MSRSLRLSLAIAIAMTVGQAVSLIVRGSRGDTDFSVFYRTAVLLRYGVGGELYPRLDAMTGWPISLAPAGLALFQPLSFLSIRAASVVWALVNLLLLAVSVGALRKFLEKSHLPQADALTPWAAIVLLVLAAGSVQVGQFSVLFVVCWLLFLVAYAAGRHAAAAVFLAVPTSIKLYPVLMLAVPLSIARSVRHGWRDVRAFVAGLIVFSLAVPALAYGTRTWDLNVSFWQHVILSPDNQVAYMQNVRAGANQSLDAVMLRYLTEDVEFHRRFPAVPHLRLPRGTAIAAAHAARVSILLVTAAAVWRWRRRHGELAGGPSLLMMAAIWSCALYLVLPETKARYAVYPFVAFVPLLAIALDRQQTPRTRGWRVAEVLLCLALLIGPAPEVARTYGVGLAGPIILWIANLRLLADR
jgi:glycosyl transferase family 87